MSVSVRVEDEAFSDVRYEVLATLCQLADADHARGKMTRLWRQCTAQYAYVLADSVVCAVLGKNGASALVESGLGEAVDGGIRIKGTRGRIEWLKKLRKNAQKGGRAKAAKRQEVGRVEAANGVPPPFPPAPAPAPAPAQKESLPVSPESLAAADRLRAEIVAQQPGHKLARTWTPAARQRWAHDLEVVHLRDGRPWPEVDRVITWLFHSQTGDFRFVVQSPKALDEKWDRIAELRSRPPRTGGYQRPPEPVRHLVDLSKRQPA